MTETTAMNVAFLIPLFVLGIGLLLRRLWTIERRLRRLSRLDAKLDALLKHAGISFDPFSDVPTGVREAIEQGESIVAIKRYREATGVGLKDAKDVVDEIRTRALPST